MKIQRIIPITKELHMYNDFTSFLFILPVKLQMSCSYLFKDDGGRAGVVNTLYPLSSIFIIIVLSTFVSIYLLKYYF